MDPIACAETSPTPDVTVAPFASVPEETVVPMLVQSLARWDPASQAWRRRPDGRARGRRAAIFAATLVLTAAASYEMYRVLSVVAVTRLQLLLLIIFTMNFAWIALPCVSALAGFLALWRGRSVSGLTIPPLQPLPVLTTRFRRLS